MSNRLGGPERTFLDIFRRGGGGRGAVWSRQDIDIGRELGNPDLCNALCSQGGQPPSTAEAAEVSHECILGPSAAADSVRIRCNSTKLKSPEGTRTSSAMPGSAHNGWARFARRMCTERLQQEQSCYVTETLGRVQTTGRVAARGITHAEAARSTPHESASRKSTKSTCSKAQPQDEAGV